MIGQHCEKLFEVGLEKKSVLLQWCLIFELFVCIHVFSLFSSGVTLTLSTLIDGKNFQQGGHKLGVALELEA